MASDTPDDRRRTDEAAAWFTRLNSTQIPAAAVEDFFAWRRDPRNRAAYDRIGDISSLAGGLRDDPDIQAAVRNAKGRQPRWRRTDGRGRTTALLFAGVVAAVGLAAVLLAPPARQGDTYHTGVGQQISVRLADGSSVHLDTDSQVRVRYEATRRLVTLERGQAFFDVVHDAARPFTVDAGQAQIRDLGTRFDVRRAAQGVDVTLAEGSVQVVPTHKASSGWTLTPGQQVRVDGDAARDAPHTVDMQAATAWTTGRLIFRDQPLGQAVAEVNRYSHKKIVLTSTTLADVRVNGAFDVGDVRGFVAAVSDSLNLSVGQRFDGAIELRPRTAPPPS